MWTSERNSRRTVEEPAAEVGQVTLGSGGAGVVLGGERRWLPLCVPGGYAWRPANGDRVLVLKAGAERESPCVLGILREDGELAPGEVRLTGQGCSLALRGGSVALSGGVLINGVTLENYVKQVVAQALGGGGSGGA